MRRLLGIILLLIVFILLLYAFLLLTQQVISGGHATMVKPLVLKRMSNGTALAMKFGEIENATVRITNTHHFPILYGNYDKQIVHGVPINGIMERGGSLYNKIIFKEDRDVYEMNISLYIGEAAPINLDKVMLVLLPKSDAEKPRENLVASVSNEYVDFAYIPKSRTKSTIEGEIDTLYKYNTLERGAIRFQDTFDLIEHQLGKTIDTFMFIQPFNKAYKHYESKLPDFNAYNKVSFMVSRNNGVWKLFVYNGKVQIESKALEDLFMTTLVDNNHYDYLYNVGDDRNLIYHHNNINSGYDLMRYYSNIPIKTYFEHMENNESRRQIL